MRLLVNDDARQGAVAHRLFESDEIWIGVTVLLEAAWALESVHELSTDETVKALRGLLGLANVRVEDSGAVAAALDAAGRGIDRCRARWSRSRSLPRVGLRQRIAA